MKTTLPLLVAALGLAAGCQSHPHSPDDPQGNYKVPSIENTYEMVGVGKPPLSFMVASGGWIKVVDETDKTLIHAAQIPPTQDGLVIRLDPDAKAITYGPLVPSTDNAEKARIVQPINPEHRFELYYQR